MLTRAAVPDIRLVTAIITRAFMTMGAGWRRGRWCSVLAEVCHFTAHWQLPCVPVVAGQPPPSDWPGPAADSGSGAASLRLRVSPLARAGRRGGGYTGTLIITSPGLQQTESHSLATRRILITVAMLACFAPK